MKINKSIVILILIAVSIFCNSGAPTNAGLNAVMLEKLNIRKGDVSKWNPEADMRVYVGDELYGFIDGGAAPYLERGVIRTGYQRLKGSDNAIVECYVFDFGSDDKALAMFEYKKTERSNDMIKDSAYPDSVAIVSPVLGGVSGCAHFGSFYVDVNVMGFKLQTQAVDVLDLFLRQFKNSIDVNLQQGNNDLNK